MIAEYISRGWVQGISPDWLSPSQENKIKTLQKKKIYLSAKNTDKKLLCLLQVYVGLGFTFEITEHLADVQLLQWLVLESDAPEVGGEVDPHKVGLQMGFVLGD